MITEKFKYDVGDTVNINGHTEEIEAVKRYISELDGRVEYQVVLKGHEDWYATSICLNDKFGTSRKELIQVIRRKNP